MKKKKQLVLDEQSLLERIVTQEQDEACAKFYGLDYEPSTTILYSMLQELVGLRGREWELYIKNTVRPKLLDNPVLIKGNMFTILGITRSDWKFPVTIRKISGSNMRAWEEFKEMELVFVHHTNNGILRAAGSGVLKDGREEFVELTTSDKDIYEVELMLLENRENKYG